MVGCVSTGSRSATRGLKLEISRFRKYKSKRDVQEGRLQVAFVVYFEIFAQLCHPGFCGTTNCCNHAGTVLLQLRCRSRLSCVSEAFSKEISLSVFLQANMLKTFLVNCLMRPTASTSEQIPCKTGSIASLSKLPSWIQRWKRVGHRRKAWSPE